MKTQLEKIRSAENQIQMFEKISDLAIEISKTDTKTWRTKIENCYLCVIEFIKWYNKQEKS